MIDVLRPYAGLGARIRAHTALRWWSAPLDAVEGLLPRRGDVLDYGCGHGLLAITAATRAPGRRVHGVDVDPEKVAAARAAGAAAGVDDRVRWDVVEGSWRPEAERYDAVVVVDVLYLLGAGVARDLLGGLVAALRPGGRLVVKEMATTPRWKWQVNLAQERVAVDVLRYTEGSTVEPVGIGELADHLGTLGLEPEVRRLDRGYPHPHAALVARRSSLRAGGL